MKEIILLLVFAAATLLGYKLIKNVPSLLHTPLMSGMNALSGVSLLAVIMALGLAVGFGSELMAYIGLVAATINVVAGFGVTDRMLQMFKHAPQKEADNG